MASLQQNLAPVKQIPIGVQFVVRNVFQRFKDFRNIQIRTFVEEITTFLSIIGILSVTIEGAYLFVSLSLEREKEIEQWTGIKLTKVDAQAGLLLIFAMYLLGLKILHYLAYKYDTAPPKKVKPLNWEEMQQQPIPTEQPVKQSQQKPLPPDSFTAMISELLNYSMYGLLFMFCTTAYTFVSLFNKKNHFVQIEQINYLVLWFVAACICYSVGKIVGKITRIKTLHHFGLTIGIMVIIMEIGLSHGFNMFLFV